MIVLIVAESMMGLASPVLSAERVDVNPDKPPSDLVRYFRGPAPYAQSGVVSERYHHALAFWAELKLWKLYDRICDCKEPFPSSLVTFEIRIAFSISVGFYALDWIPSAIMRQVKHDFFLKRSTRKMRTEALSYAEELCSRRSAKPNNPTAVGKRKPRDYMT